jgi:hypothetical protein
MLEGLLRQHLHDVWAGLLDAGGAAWPLALLSWRRAPARLRAGALLLPGVLCQLLAATDTARMLAFAAPCLIPLALAHLDRLPAVRWKAAVGLLALSVGSMPLSALAVHGAPLDQHLFVVWPPLPLRVLLVALVVALSTVGVTGRLLTISSTRAATAREPSPRAS